jgi:hypothetical protein
LFLFQDPSQADRVLGQAMTRSPFPLAPDVGSSPDIAASPPQLALPPARSSHNNTPAVGTPIRLAPSTSAFRKPGQGPKAATSMPGPQPATPPVVGTPGTPSKGVIGQFSDFVFGW